MTEKTKNALRNKKTHKDKNGRNCDDGLNEIQNQVSEDTYKQILCIELKTHGKENVLKAIHELEKREDILYVGPDYEIQLFDTTPNDVYYDIQWAPEQLDLPQAWDITTGSSSVVVGVMDTGIDETHPDLRNRVNSDLSRDFTNGSVETLTTVTDPHGHGTKSAGIIGAQGNNNIVGVAGVCWNVNLVSLRVYDSGGDGYSSYVAAAIDYAIEKSIPILNLSGGWFHTRITTHYDVLLETVISNYPGLFVCAAGNSGNDLDTYDVFPAKLDLPNLITVGNSIQDDGIDVWSNYSKNWVHLFAPGEGSLTCYPVANCLAGTHDSEHYADGYHEYGGTSAAAPQVTGVAALIKSIRPDLTATEIKALILNNVDKVDAFSEKCITGGRLNAYKAVRATTEPQTFAGDVNGDGRSDLILSRRISGKRALTVYLGKTDGSFEEPITTQSSRNFFYDDPAFVGDFNGDGRTDVVIHWSSNNDRQLLVYIGNADGTFNEGENLPSTRFHDPNQYPCQFFVADVNGDSKDDFVVHYRNLNGKRYSLVYQGTSNAPYLTDAIANALETDDDYLASNPAYMGDFNGDGCSDMVVHYVSNGKRQLLVYKGNTNGTFSQGENLSSTRGHNPAYYPTQNL